jgi:hypothetical protein
MTQVKLLTEPTNYAVVQLPGRAFPGVVFQGDSLNILIADLREAANEVDPEEKALALCDLIDHLARIQRQYEAVLGREGIKMPYLPSNHS